MNKTCTVIGIAAALALSACGSSPASTSDTAVPAVESSTASTSPSPLLEDTTTTTLRRTIVVPTTTTIEISRDSRLAVMRCQSDLDVMAFVNRIAIDPSMLDTAITDCKEAAVQLKADGIVATQVQQSGSDLVVSTAGVNVSLSFAALKVLDDKYDNAARLTLQNAVDDYSSKATAALAD